MPTAISALLVLLGASSVAPTVSEPSSQSPSDTLPQQPSGPVGNPFAGFETHRLDNGVKLWYRHLPGAPNATVSMAIPYGSDQDPEGKEELAHLTEHMLFGDHDGRTEREIKDEIEGRGGRRNGLTYPDHTFYYATIGREHGLLALEWLSRLVEPHAMDPEVVDRNRQPVANEIGARPRELGDWLVALLDPEWLRMPRFWELEFGLDVRSNREWDRWASLFGLTSEDLRWFYDRYYPPEAMTVTVVGDLPRDSVLRIAERSFGTFRPRPVPDAYRPPVDPGRFRRSVSWNFAPAPRYRTLFKLFEPTAEEHVELLFVTDLLRRRLGQRLRYGERKAVYGMSVDVVQRGPAMYVFIQGRVDEEDLAWARGVVEEELDALRSGALSAADFEADRRALVERLKSAHQTSEEISFQVRTHFYDRRLHDDFPDLVAAYESMDRGRLARFAGEHLVRDRRVEWIWRPHPVGQAGVAVGIVLLTLLTIRVTGQRLTRPIEMGRIRYVARIRLGPLFLLLTVAGVTGGAILLLRLFAAGIERVMHHWVAPVDSYVFQVTVMAAMGAAGLALLIGYLSLLPRKILVFPDHIRIKYLAYRSRIVRPEDVRDLSLRPFHSVWLSGRILGTLPFTTGLLRPGIHLELDRGPSLFFRARDSDELYGVMREVLERPRPR